MKILATKTNPTMEDFRIACATCATLNAARNCGKVRPVLFNRLGHTILAFGWEQTMFPNFTQELLDKQAAKQPTGSDRRRAIVELIEDNLGRKLRLDDNCFTLDESDLNDVRSKIDPDPTDAIQKCGVDHELAEFNLPSDIGWSEVDKLLRLQPPIDNHANNAWFNELPNICSTKIQFQHYMPVISFIMDSSHEQYHLLAPPATIMELVNIKNDWLWDRYYYRLFKLKGRKLDEIPTLYAEHCMCEHMMELETSEGCFRFHMHPTNQEDQTFHGFRHKGDCNERFTVLLTMETVKTA